MTQPETLTAQEKIILTLFGGKSIFTLHSTHSGDSYTYKVEEANKRNPDDPKEIPPFFVSVLTGPDNTNDYDYIGVIFDRRNFQWTKKSSISRDAASVKFFERSFQAIIAQRIPDFLEFIPSSRCARCGITLTVRDSVLASFGPKCAEIVGAAYGGAKKIEAPKADQPVYQTSQTPAQRAVQTGKVLHMPTQPAIKTIRHGETTRNNEFVARIKPSPVVDGAKLRDIASPVREVSKDEIEQAVTRFKRDSPDAYTQGGTLPEHEARAVAFIKFKHELSKKEKV
jgi:hypothetical protein